MLQQLTFFPIAEMSRLRAAGPPAAAIAGPIPVARGGHPRKVPSAQQVARQSELRVSFAIPTAAVRLGLRVMGGTHPNGSGFAADIFINFAPAAPGGAGVAEAGGGTGTYQVTAGFDLCSMVCPVWSGRTVTNATAPCPALAAPLLLKRTDTALDIAVWTDNVFLEVFIMGGRQAWTVPLPCTAITAGQDVTVVASAGPAPTLLNATLWGLNAIEYENVGPSSQAPE